MYIQATLLVSLIIIAATKENNMNSYILHVYNFNNIEAMYVLSFLSELLMCVSWPVCFLSIQQKIL